MLTNDKNILALVKKYAPERFNKRIVNVESTERLQLTGLNWSGGYKNEYVAVHLESGESVHVPEPAWNEKYRARFVQMEAGVAIICYAYCGLGKRIEVYLHPSNITPLLEKPVELTNEEKAVLYFTRCYKNSYGGETDMRRKEAVRLGYPFTKEKWEAVQNQLRERGLLNKANSLTMDGRNACPNSIEHKHTLSFSSFS